MMNELESAPLKTEEIHIHTTRLYLTSLDQGNVAPTMIGSQDPGLHAGLLHVHQGGIAQVTDSEHHRCRRAGPQPISLDSSGSLCGTPWRALTGPSSWFGKRIGSPTRTESDLPVNAD